MHRFFMTGTDTDVGKTLVACGLLKALNLKGLKTIGYKPISAGCERVNGELINGDAVNLMNASSVKLSLAEVNPVAFEPPIAPHIAANQANTVIRPQDIVTGWHHLAEKSPDVLLTEGAGGWQLPISTTQTLPEVIKQIPQDVILTVGMRLGCLNHALLTVDSIKHSGFRLVGWIANHLSDDMLVSQQNIATLKNMIDAPLIAEIPWFGDDGAELNHTESLLMRISDCFEIDSLLELD